MGSYDYSLQVCIAFKALLHCTYKSSHFTHLVGFNPTAVTRASDRPQHECPDCCLLLSIHFSPAVILKKDEPFPPTSKPYACMRTSTISKCLTLSCSQSKHIFVAKRPSPSKQQKFKHSLDVSAQLKLINSLPLIYWEPEQDAVHAEVAGKDFYYHLLTINLNGFPSLPQKLDQKVCVNMALCASQTQNTRPHSEQFSAKLNQESHHNHLYLHMKSL